MTDFGVSLTNAAYAQERSAYDLYQTPDEVTVALMSFLQLPCETMIWEPACGPGRMVKTLRDLDYGVLASDLYDYGEFESGVDFTACTTSRAPWIITNPPFNRSEEFICAALNMAELDGFAFLLKSQYWHSARRRQLFNRRRPQYILPLTWRPDFHFGAKGGAPTMECLWTVWGKDHGESLYIPLEKLK